MDSAERQEQTGLQLMASGPRLADRAELNQSQARWDEYGMNQATEQNRDIWIGDRQQKQTQRKQEKNKPTANARLRLLRDQ